jgi:putative flippase GtrA
LSGAGLAAPQAWLLFLRFGAVGLLNAAFGYAAFAVLVLVGVWPGVALVAANTAGVVFNFQTSRRLVFRAGPLSRGSGRALRFAVVYGTVLGLNWVLLRTLHWLGLSVLLAQALLVLPVAAVSFLGQRLFVFRPESEPA